MMALPHPCVKALSMKSVPPPRRFLSAVCPSSPEQSRWAEIESAPRASEALMERRSFLSVLFGSVLAAGIAPHALAVPGAAAPRSTLELDDVQLQYAKKGGGHGRGGHARGRGRGRHRGWFIGRRRRMRRGWYGPRYGRSRRRHARRAMRR